MADPRSLNKPHLHLPDLNSPLQPNPSKSYTNFLCKSLLIIFILVILPFFPSRSPEFINQTLLTKLWELLHLLLIGIVVSYGLFSRRNAQMRTEIHSTFENPQDYLSGFSHFSSIFEDGFENPIGSDEKRVIQIWNSQYLNSESMVVAQESHVLDQCGKVEPFIDYKPLGLPIRSLRSRKLETEIAESSKGSFRSSDKIRKKGKVRGMVPINLEEKFKETMTLPSPIPWRSRSERMEMREDVINVKSNSHSRPLSVGNFEFESLKSQSFRYPLASHESSSVSWELPNLETENLERNMSFSGSLKPRSLANSKARGFSIGSTSEMNIQRSSEDDVRAFTKSENDESLGRGKLGVDSLSSNAKSVKDGKGSSLFSLEMPSSEKENLEMDKSFYGSSKPDSLTDSTARGFSIGSSSGMNFRKSSEDDLRDLTKSKRDGPLGRGKLGVDSSNLDGKPVTDGTGLYSFSCELPNLEMENLERDKSFGGPSKAASLTDSNALGFSIGSSSEMNYHGSSKDDPRDFTKSKRDDPPRRGKLGIDSSNSDRKHVTDGKSLYRGRSVRTIRANEHMKETRKTGEVSKNHIDEMIRGNFESVPVANTEKRTGFDYINGDNHEDAENGSRSGFENFPVSSNEEEAAEANFAGEAELDCSEVDKKAGEFIAKFREQIRLQKIASFRG